MKVERLLLSLSLLGVPALLAQELPDTSANEEHGAVGCTQTSTGTYCPHTYSSPRSYTIPPKPFPVSVVQALDKAASSPSCIDSGYEHNCNFFVGSVGRSLDIPYFRNVLSAEHPDHYVANKMYDFISKAVNSRGSGWRELDADGAYDAAGEGEFVVVVARSKDPTKSGHVAIVAGHGNGKLCVLVNHNPCVRDSASPRELSTVSKQFSSTKLVEPIYAVWAGGPR